MSAPQNITTAIVIACLSLMMVSCAKGPGLGSKVVVEVMPETDTTGQLANDGSARLLELTNQARIKKRRLPLSVDTRLTRAALDHSQSMQKYGYFDHKGRDGENFQVRMLRYGYPKSHSAENIAMVHDPALVFQMWYNSRGHYKNMMNKKYTRIGIGRAGNYWTAVYAAPDGT